MTLETRTVSGFAGTTNGFGGPCILDENGPKVEIECILCHLQLSDGDVEQIAQLVERGVEVTRNTMQGDDYLSVSWSFTAARDEAEDEEPGA